MPKLHRRVQLFFYNKNIIANTNRYWFGRRNSVIVFLRFLAVNRTEMRLSMNRENTLRVGVITTTHGIKGEVKVYPTTDDANRFLDLKTIYLDTGKELLPLEIEGVKFFKQFVILKFKGIDNINDIEKYKNKDLLIDRADAVELAEGEFFIPDLIGLSVVTEDGTPFGTLKDVMETGANDVFIVETLDEKEILLPYIDDCVKKIDLTEKTVTVHLMKGLLD